MGQDSMPIPNRYERAAKTGKPLSVAIKDIQVLPQMQPRRSLKSKSERESSEDAIRRYTQVVLVKGRNGFPSILVTWVEGVGLVIVDGHHRFTAHQRAGADKIKCVVKIMSLEVARLEAGLANTQHGLPLKRSDHVEVFKRYVESDCFRKADGSPKSYREMAQELDGIRSYRTINNWMKQYFPAVAAEIGGVEPEPDFKPLDPDAKRVAYFEEHWRELDRGACNLIHYLADTLDKKELARYRAFQLVESLASALRLTPGDLAEIGFVPLNVDF